MLNHAPFGFDLFKKYAATFGALFREIYVLRSDSDGVVQQTIRVPISYGPREKVLGRTEGDPDINRPASVILPAMSFEMGDPAYDSTRKLSSINLKVLEANGLYSRQYVPVPYNIPFTLHVGAKFTGDANAIVEQILPFFTPEFPTTLDLVPAMNQKWDVPVVLVGVNKGEEWAGDFKDRSSLVWSLQFVMRAYLFGPIASAPVIKFTTANLYQPFTNTAVEGVGISSPVDRVTVQPGLTANGQPTTHLADTVPYQQIQAGDDWGIIVSIAGNLDPSEGTGGTDEPVTD